jgi:phosphoribosylanthranilate isomerase
MNFLTKIKLSRITNLSDARYAAAAGMDYISFCFDPGNERFISPAHAKQIMDWLAGIACVGEFVNEPVETINEVCSLIGLDLVQLSGSYTNADISLIQVPVIWETETHEGIPEGVFAVQFASEAGLQKQLVEKHQTILHFASGDHNLIKSQIQEYRPFAVSFTGGDEDKPGLRDFSDLSEVLNGLSAD